METCKVYLYLLADHLPKCTISFAIDAQEWMD
jgi:hypothetical protein